MKSLPRIPGDFNNLGYEEPNVIPLGEADLTGRLGHVPENGQEVIVYEFGEMEAQGILRSKHDATGAVLWEVAIDPETIRYWEPDEVATARAAEAARQQPSSPPASN